MDSNEKIDDKEIKKRAVIGVTAIVCALAITMCFKCGIFKLPFKVGDDPIETICGVHYISLDDIKEMCNEGKFPSQVYELAKLDKIRDPHVGYKYVPKVCGWLCRGVAKQYKQNAIYGEYWCGFVEKMLSGRYFKKVNDSSVELVCIGYDDLLDTGYYAITLNISLNSSKMLKSKRPDYLAILSSKNTTISVDGNNVYGWVYEEKDCNLKDTKTVDEIAGEIYSICKARNFTKEQCLEFITREVISSLLENGNAQWIGKPIKLEVWDGDKTITTITVKNYDSLIVASLLKGVGDCYIKSFLTCRLLERMGYDAALMTYTTTSESVHTIVLINSSSMSERGQSVVKIDEKTYIPIDVTLSGNMPITISLADLDTSKPVYIEFIKLK